MAGVLEGVSVLRVNTGMTWRGTSFPPKQSLHGGATSLPRIRDGYDLISTGVPALGAQRKEVLQAALGRAFKLLAIGSGVGLVLGLLATKVLAFSGHAARSPGLCGCGSGDAAAGPGGHVDSCAACAIRQSAGPAARGVSRARF